MKYGREKYRGESKTVPPHYVQKFTDYELEEMAERAAIMEFDGGLSRAEAEAAAERFILMRRREI